MGMAVSDVLFVSRRRKLVKSGPLVLAVCLLLIFAFGVWLYFFQPQLINFVEVARQIEAGTLDDLTIQLMAVMLPIAMLMCLVLIAAVVCFCWAGLSNERRYLQVIDDLSEHS